MTRHIIIGASVPHARSAAANYRKHGFDVVAYASIRSLDRFRGVVADAAILCGVEDSPELQAALAPVLATSSRIPKRPVHAGR